ncbi:MAG: polysaccharide biosynthesis C-terminal domain-containing protein [Clostridia bacterium]|nr:polysaccharide biosynthesis C-terminal domain-containing protein [Clostridia bacterium]
MGLFTLTSGVYSFAITLATSGINLAVVRLVSASLPYNDNMTVLDKNGDSRVGKIMRKAFFYCLFFSLLATIILFTSAKGVAELLLGDKRVIPSLKLMALSLVPISLSSALNGYFCAVRRVYKNIIVSFFEQGVKISLISFGISLLMPAGIEYAIMAIALGGMIGELFSCIISFVLYIIDRKRHREKKSENVGNVDLLSKKGDRVDKKLSNIGRKCYWGRGIFSFNVERRADATQEEFSVFSIAFPMAISAYVRSALLTIEHLAIPWGLKKSGIGAKDALASYGVLHGMVFPVLLFPSSVLGAFSSLLVPELSSAFEAKDFSRIKYIVSRVFYFSLIFSLGVSGIFISFSHEIGIFLYGSNEAGEFIRLLAPLIPLMYLDGAVDSMLKGLGEQIYTMRVNIIDSFISVLLILVLLPNMGITGYIVVIFIMELFNTSFSIMRLISITKIDTPVIKWVGKPLLNIILSTILIRLLFDSGLFDSLFGNLVFGKGILICQIALTALLYLIFSRISGAISSDEIKLAKRLVNR